MQRQLLGLCLQPALIPDFAILRPLIGWIELQAENFPPDSAAIGAASALRDEYHISLHSVGLSLGSAAGVDADCLSHVASLSDRFQPGFISDHLSWSSNHGIYLSSLLPLPYTSEALDVVCRNIQVVQAKLKRTVLLENIAAYIRFRHSEMTEPEFLTEVTRRTGCGILLDINNVFVNSANFAADPMKYLRGLPVSSVFQYHLGGHSKITLRSRELLFDDHNSPIVEDVLALYRKAVQIFGAKPTFIEWETRPPSLASLLSEADKAGEIMGERAGSAV